MAKSKDFDFEAEFGGRTAEDEWQTSSGLPLANADVEVLEASFGFNAKIGADTLCMNFTFGTLDDDGQVVGETIDQSFSVGSGWEARDGGKYLVDENGNKNRTVNKQTNFGRLIDSAREAISASDEEFPFTSPRIAEDWIGTRWHVGTVQVTTRNPQTEKETTKDAFVFTKYYGKTTTEKKAPAAKGKTSSKAAAKADEGDDELAALRAQLVALAGECEDHEEFVDKALEIKGVEGGPLERAVMRAKGDASIWAEVKGS